jgi:hypothetical protein
MAIARLDFARAWAMNPLGFVFMGAFAAWWVNSVYEVATSRKTRLSRWLSTRLWMLVLAGICVLMVFGIARILVLIYR